MFHEETPSRMRSLSMIVLVVVLFLAGFTLYFAATGSTASKGARSASKSSATASGAAAAAATAGSRAATAAASAAQAATRAAKGVEQSNQDAACRSYFSTRVTTARTNLDDAQSQLTKIQYFGLRDLTATPAAKATSEFQDVVIGGNVTAVAIDINQRRLDDATNLYQFVVDVPGPVFHKLCEQTRPTG